MSALEKECTQKGVHSLENEITWKWVHLKMSVFENKCTWKGVHSKMDFFDATFKHCGGSLAVEVTFFLILHTITFTPFRTFSDPP